MIAKLQNPILAAAVSLLISVALGAGVCARALGPLLEQAAAARAKKPVTELKQKGWDFWTIEIDNLSNELKDERGRLRKQSELLDQREVRMAAERKELAAIRGELDGMRHEIADKVITIRADEAKNLRSLAQTYTNLTPRAAVAIIREMDDVTAVKILYLMKPDVVGPIFEELSRTAGTDGTLARRAAILSEKLRVMDNNKPASQP